MASRADGAGSRVRVAALLLIAGLAAPAGEHLYWVLGGTWGLHRSVGSHIEESTTTGVRIVAAVVVVLLVAAVFVVLARVGLWQQPIVSDRVIRFFAWALAAVFLGEALASFTYSREYEWWLYGPGALVIALLASWRAREEDGASTGHRNAAVDSRRGGDRDLGAHPRTTGMTHRTRVACTSGALLLWTLAAAHGYAWQMIWLPAAVAGAAWPHHHTRMLGHCRRRVRRHRDRPA